MAQSLELVAVHGVGDFLRRVVLEVHVLAGERPDTRGDEHQPRDHWPAVRRLLRQELAGLLGEIEHDGVAVEHRHVAIHDGRHLGVGVDRQVAGLMLLTLARIHGYRFVGEPHLLQAEGYLHRVRCGAVVKLDHRCLREGLGQGLNPTRPGAFFDSPAPRLKCVFRPKRSTSAQRSALRYRSRFAQTLAREPSDWPHTATASPSAFTAIDGLIASPVSCAWSAVAVPQPLPFVYRLAQMLMYGPFGCAHTATALPALSKASRGSEAFPRSSVSTCSG